MTSNVTIKLDKKHLAGLDGFGVPYSVIESTQHEFQIANREDFLKAQELAGDRFGKNSRAYQTIMNGVNTANAKGANFFFNNLVKCAISFDDLEEMYKSGRAKEISDGSFYTDTIDLILRTAIHRRGINKQILEDLVKQVKERGFEFSSANPLRISGLNLVADGNKENKYGLLFNVNGNTKILNDDRFAYGIARIHLGNKIIPLGTGEHGLSVVYMYRDGTLNSHDCIFAGSGGDGGRVIVRR